MANNKKMRVGGNQTPEATMRCTNEKCPKQHIEEPLELFDGSLACPHCGCLLNRNTFKVTEYNDSIFKLSQLYYFNYLTETSKNKLPVAEGEKMVKTALYYCREASRFGHPEARVKLGFYWEAGYMKKRSSADRYKMAYRYYEDVLLLDEDKVDVEKDENKVPTVKDYTDLGKIRSVRKEAAMRLKNLCTTVDAGLSLKGLEKEFMEVGVSLSGNVQLTRESSKDDNIYNILACCNSKMEHPPIFGYFVITAGSLRSLFLRENRSLKELIRNAKKLEIKWILRDAPFDYDTDNDDFHILTDSDSSLPGGGNETIDDETPIILYFFNGHYDGKAANGLQAKKSYNKVKSCLFRKGARDTEMTEGFMTFLDEVENLSKQPMFFERVFFLDDVYFAWKRNSSNPIKGLGDYMQDKVGGKA